MKTLRTLRTLALAASAFISACGPTASHVKPTATVATASKVASRTSSRTAKTTSGCFTAEELAQLAEMNKRVHACGDEFRLCKKTNPENTCKKKMDVCSDKIKHDYHIKEEEPISIK